MTDTSPDVVGASTRWAESGAYGLQVTHHASGHDAYVDKVLGTALTRADLQFDLYVAKPTGAGEMNFAVLDSGGYFLGQLDLVVNAATGYEELDFYDGAYHWHAAAATLSYGAWHHVELQLVVSTTATGNFALLLDGKRSRAGPTSRRRRCATLRSTSCSSARSARTPPSARRCVSTTCWSRPCPRSRATGQTG
jgi:hypothetical protein